MPQRYVVNLQKGGMAPFIFGLMLYYDNFTLVAWLYLALHGSYGMFWFMKDLVIPDKNFEYKVTFLSIWGMWFIVLQPYMYAAYLICSRKAP